MSWPWASDDPVPGVSPPGVVDQEEGVGMWEAASDAFAAWAATARHGLSEGAETVRTVVSQPAEVADAASDAARAPFELAAVAVAGAAVVLAVDIATGARVLKSVGVL